MSRRSRLRASISVLTFGITFSPWYHDGLGGNDNERAAVDNDNEDDALASSSNAEEDHHHWGGGGRGGGVHPAHVPKHNPKVILVVDV